MARKQQPPPQSPLVVSVPFICGLGFYAVRLDNVHWVITTIPDATGKSKAVSEVFWGNADMARAKLREYTMPYLASRPQVEELPCAA